MDGFVSDDTRGDDAGSSSTSAAEPAGITYLPTKVRIGTKEDHGTAASTRAIACSSKQFRRRWLKSLRKSEWSPAEDELLLRLHRVHGKNWSRIAQKMIGRTAQQCHGRWVSSLQASLANGPWTPSEDEALCRLHGIHANAWWRIGKEMRGRSSSQCRDRWIYVLNKRAAFSV